MVSDFISAKTHRAAPTAGSSGHVRKTTIRSLTGARFVAAIAVVIFHFFRFPGAPDWINRIFSFGYLGVPFFFVLSGFVLAYNYIAGDAVHVTRARLKNRKGFWIARFARIYPVYALALALEAPFFVHELRLALPSIGGHFLIDLMVITLLATTLMQTVVPLFWIERGFNTPGWTLSVEAIFYILFPFFGTPFARAGVGVLIALIAGALVWLSALPIFCFPMLPPNGSFLGVHGAFTWMHSPFYLMPMFLLGMAVSRIFVAARESNRVRRFAPGISVVLLAILLFSFARGVPTILGEQQNVVAAAFFSVLIFFLAFDSGPISAALSCRPMLLLGEASYALYILQTPAAHYLQQLFTKFLHRSENFSYALVLCVSLIIVSVLVNQFFEIPARAFLRRILISDG